MSARAKLEAAQAHMRELTSQITRLELEAADSERKSCADNLFDAFNLDSQPHLSSLQEATRDLPVPGLMEHVAASFRHVKEHNLTSRDALSDDVSAALHLYTRAWDHPPDSLHRRVNDLLRWGGRSADDASCHAYSELTDPSGQLRAFVPLFKLLLEGTHRLQSQQPFQGRVWRGVRKRFRHYTKGSLHQWWSFSSCSRTLDVIENKLFLGKDGTRTLFSIDVKAGVDLGAYSAFKEEKEVILLPGTVLRVKSIADLGNELVIVDLEQHICDARCTHAPLPRPAGALQPKIMPLAPAPSLKLANLIGRFSLDERSRRFVGETLASSQWAPLSADLHLTLPSFPALVKGHATPPVPPPGKGNIDTAAVAGLPTATSSTARTLAKLVGSCVRVLPSKTLHEMKDGMHPTVGWNASKEYSLGREGSVVEADDSDGTLKVRVVLGDGNAVENWYPADALWIAVKHKDPTIVTGNGAGVVGAGEAALAIDTVAISAAKRLVGLAVHIESSPHLLDMKQGRHATVGWNEQKERSLGHRGVVLEVDETDCTVKVQITFSTVADDVASNWFPPDSLWVSLDKWTRDRIGEELARIPSAAIAKGARVLIIESRTLHLMRQGKHDTVGWNPTKDRTIGKQGIVFDLDDTDGCIKVSMELEELPSPLLNWYPLDSIWVPFTDVR